MKIQPINNNQTVFKSKLPPCRSNNDPWLELARRCKEDKKMDELDEYLNKLANNGNDYILGFHETHKEFARTEYTFKLYKNVTDYENCDPLTPGISILDYPGVGIFCDNTPVTVFNQGILTTILSTLKEIVTEGTEFNKRIFDIKNNAKTYKYLEQFRAKR